LAEQLEAYKNQQDVLVLALPRGGVPVAYEIAKTLGVPLDIFMVKKLGVPGQEELAMGALTMDGTIIFNEDIRQRLNLPEFLVKRVIESARQELLRRELTYRDDRPFPPFANKIIILVDDGIATGATMRAAIQALQQQKPAQIIVAAPVAANDTCEEIALLVDKLVCPLRPIHLYSVSSWYENFSQTTDAEVYKLLADANAENKNIKM
jgi:predicted phosphoribosyltransferase